MNIKHLGKKVISLGCQKYEFSEHLYVEKLFKKMALGFFYFFYYY